MIAMELITGDVKLDHSVKVVLAMFLHYDSPISLYPNLIFGSYALSLHWWGCVYELSSLSWSREYLHILFGLFL